MKMKKISEKYISQTFNEKMSFILQRENKIRNVKGKKTGGY